MRAGDEEGEGGVGVHTRQRAGRRGRGFRQGSQTGAKTRDGREHGEQVKRGRQRKNVQAKQRKK